MGIGLVVCCAGCAAPRPPLIATGSAPGRAIPGITRCDHRFQPTISLDPEKPLVLLVHGCNASGGHLRALSEVFALHDQQTLCFNYNDRDSMVETAARLGAATRMLVERHGFHRITVVGHSQGGLISRRAYATGKATACALPGSLRLRLVTISSPFSGIAAASHCGLLALHIASLGFTPLICQLATGSKWTEIHPAARFIVQPGGLDPRVEQHLMVLTDERGICYRRDSDGSCEESDDIFSLPEQRQPLFRRSSRVSRVTVAAGHTEIVGDERTPPLKLIEVLQRRGVLRRTPPRQRVALRTLLARLF